MKDVRGKLIIETNKNLKQWMDYIMELFDDNRKTEDKGVLDILKEESRSSISSQINSSGNS